MLHESERLHRDAKQALVSKPSQGHPSAHHMSIGQLRTPDVMCTALCWGRCASWNCCAETQSGYWLPSTRSA
jgi:hypothetical protein